MNVVIACGGTGGHLFPGLAVAETLLSRGHAVRLFVSSKAVDNTALAALTKRSSHSPAKGATLSVKTLSAVGLGRSRQWMRFCVRLAQATRECLADRAAFAPEAVLGMGGFTSAPAVLAARWGRTRTLLHESNAVPGKANRWLGGWADHVAVGLADCARFFGNRPVTVTGTPIRAALRRGKLAAALDQLGLSPGKLTVLVVGGSQGAQAINEALAAALPWLEDWRQRVQFVHLSGPAAATSLQTAYEQNGLSAKVLGFCHQMELAYSAADLVISRAGAATLAELAAFGRPSILMPYPHAAGDHQSANARVFERAGAAVVLTAAQLSGLHALAGERLADLLVGLLGDEPRRARMATAAQALAIPNAHERIADLVEGPLAPQPSARPAVVGVQPPMRQWAGALPN